MRKFFSEKKSYRENQNKHFAFINFSPENRAVYETTCKKYGTARQTTDDNIIRRMLLAR